MCKNDCEKCAFIFFSFFLFFFFLMECFKVFYICMLYFYQRIWWYYFWDIFFFNFCFCILFVHFDVAIHFMQIFLSTLFITFIISSIIKRSKWWSLSFVMSHFYNPLAIFKCSLNISIGALFLLHFSCILFSFYQLK